MKPERITKYSDVGFRAAMVNVDWGQLARARLNHEAHKGHEGLVGWIEGRLANSIDQRCLLPRNPTIAGLAVSDFGLPRSFLIGGRWHALTRRVPRRAIRPT